MEKYHKFVFDISKRKFIGKFEEMYQHEDTEEFDSWYASNLNNVLKRIHLAVLNKLNFNSILDFGCGKGSFTHLLKKENNYVLGLDISETAIKKAKQYYGNEIEFQVLKDNDLLSAVGERHFQLTTILETLSYIKNWEKVIKSVSKYSDYLYISLFIPKNPIGFVKSFQDLINVSSESFDINEKVIYNDEFIFLLLKNKNKEK